MAAFRDSGGRKAGYAVRDRLHARQGRTAVGESPQEEEQAERLKRIPLRLFRVRGRRDRHRARIERVIRQAPGDHAEEAEEEQVGRHCEDASRLADAPQVGQGDKGDYDDAQARPVSR